MNTYYIEETKAEMSYIELRLLLYIDCDEKNKKITELLNYMNANYFIVNLTTLYFEGWSADNLGERQEVMSLTVDMVNDKMRFKLWNGISTFWLYHLKDVFIALNERRDDFSEIYDKYAPITKIFSDFKERWKTSVYHFSYEYYPQNDDVEMVYFITFSEDVKKSNYTNHLLSKLNAEIAKLGTNVTQNLNFRIKHSFRTAGCLPCQKAKEERERERNERENV